jgi:hypothetical protein
LGLRPSFVPKKKKKEEYIILLKKSTLLYKIQISFSIPSYLQECFTLLHLNIFFEETKMDYIINSKSPSEHKMSQEGTKESVQYLQRMENKNNKKKDERNNNYP